MSSVDSDTAAMGAFDFHRDVTVGEWQLLHTNYP
jgi:hypothetical protein